MMLTYFAAVFKENMFIGIFSGHNNVKPMKGSNCMKAVIMCGGLGSRLRPITENTPKPLVKLLNVPILKQIIDKLIKSGITDISLSLGYMATDIISYCESLKIPAELHYRTEEKPLGTAGGVKNCLPETDGNVLVLSGDNIFGFDIGEIEKFHNAAGADFTVVGKSCADPREYGTILTDVNGGITGFSEKPSWENAESFLINTGVYLFRGEILKLIPENTQYDFSVDLFPKILNSDRKFMCFKTDKMWGDIGEFDAFLALSAELLSHGGAAAEYDGRFYFEDFTDGNGNTVIAPSLIGADFSMKKNNRIGPFAVIGNGVCFGSGCTVSESIVGSGCTVSDSTDITGAILDDCVQIGDNCCIESGSVFGYGVKMRRFARTLGGVKVWPGLEIAPESVVGNDVFFETPEKTDFDIFGISGKICSQLSVADAVKIGQALASVGSIKKIGIGSDGGTAAEIYRTALISGARACGAVCYDFEEIFKAQAYFYSAYCSLDAFVFVSVGGNTVNLSFFGSDGLPFSEKTARKIGSNFRFSSFSFAEVNAVPEKFNMNLLSTVYGAALNRTYTQGEYGVCLTCECENEIVKTTFDAFIGRHGTNGAKTKIQMLINGNGTDMYCIENERFYSSDRLRAAVAETVFAEGKDILVKEDASDCIFAKAKEYGRAVIEVFESSFEETDTAGISLTDNLWNFDALFLGAKIAGILSLTGLTLEELCRLQDDFTVRRSIVETNCPPGEIKRKIKETGAEKGARNNVYYGLTDRRGTVRMRQLGNSSKIRILAEAADMETAKEISAAVQRKFGSHDIDKRTK